MCLGDGVSSSFRTPIYLGKTKAHTPGSGFYINLPVGGLVVILLLFFLTVPAGKGAGQGTFLSRLLKLDLIGFFFFAPAAIQFILALEWGGNKFPWHSATIIGLFCGSFGTLLVFLAWESHMGGKAMIPLSIIRRRVIWSSCLNYGCFMGSVLTVTYYLPIYFQSVKNASPTLSGVDLLPSIISTALFGPLTGASSKSDLHPPASLAATKCY